MDWGNVGLMAGSGLGAILGWELGRFLMRKRARPAPAGTFSVRVNGYTPSPPVPPLGRREGAAMVYTPEEIELLARMRRRDEAIAAYDKALHQLVDVAAESAARKGHPFY